MDDEKEKQYRVEHCLRFLARYHARLVQKGEFETIQTPKAEAELPMAQRPKERVARLLLEEFGTVMAVNKGIESYRASHS